jgi:hypothetical protein
VAPAGGLIGAVDSFAAWADAYARKIDAYIEQVNALYEPYRNSPIPLPFPIPPRIPPVAHKAWQLIAGENPQTDEESLHRLGQYWADESRTTFELAETAASAARSVRVEWDGDGAPFAFQAEMQELSHALTGLAQTQAGIALGVSMFRDQTIAARNAFRVQVVMLLVELVAAVVTAIFSFGLSFAGFLARGAGRVAALRAAIGTIISRIWAVRFANSLVELARRGIPWGLQSLRRGLPATLRRLNPLDLTRAVAAREGRRLQRALIGDAIAKARQAGRRIGSDELRDAMSREMRDQITRNLDSMLRGAKVDPPTTRLQQMAYDTAKDAIAGGAGRRPLTTARGIVSGVAGYGGKSAALYGGGGWVLQEGMTRAEVSQYGSQTYTSDPAGLASALVGAALGGGPLALGGTAPHMAVHGAIGGALGYAGVQLVEAATTDLTLAQAWDSIVNPHPMRAGGASNFLDAVLQGAVSGGVWERFVGEYGLGEMRGAGRNLLDFVRPPSHAPAGTTSANVPIHVEMGTRASAASVQPGAIGTGPPAAIPSATATLPATATVGDAGAPAPASQSSPTSSGTSAPSSTTGGRGPAVAGAGARAGTAPAGATPDPSASAPTTAEQSSSRPVPDAAEPRTATTPPVAPAAGVNVTPLDPGPVEVAPLHVEPVEVRDVIPTPVEVRDVTPAPVEVRDVTSELRDVTSEVRDVTSEVRDVTSELEAPQLADPASRMAPTAPPAAADAQPPGGQVQQLTPESQLAPDASAPDLDAGPLGQPAADLRQPLVGADVAPPPSTVADRPPSAATPPAESAPASQASNADNGEVVPPGDSEPGAALATGGDASEPAPADATGGGTPPPPVPPAPPAASDDQPPAFHHGKQVRTRLMPPTELAIPDTYRASLSEQDRQKLALVLEEAVQNRHNPDYWKPVPDGWLVQDPGDAEVLALRLNRSGEVVAHSKADFERTTTDGALAKDALDRGLADLQERSVIDIHVDEGDVDADEGPKAVRVRLPNESTVDVEWVVTDSLDEGQSRIDVGDYELGPSGWRQTKPATIRLSVTARAGTAEEMAADARDQALQALRRLGANLPGPVGNDSVTDTSGRSPHAGELPQGHFWHDTVTPIGLQPGAAPPAGAPPARELLRDTLARIQSGAPESADRPVAALTGNPEPHQGLKLAHFGDGTTIAFGIGVQGDLKAGEVRVTPPAWRRSEGGVFQVSRAFLRVSGEDTSAAQMDAMVEAGLRKLQEMVPGNDRPGITSEQQQDLQDLQDGRDLSEVGVAVDATGGWAKEGGRVLDTQSPSGLRRLEISMAVASDRDLLSRLQEWGYRLTVLRADAAPGLTVSAEPPIDSKHRLRPVEIRLAAVDEAAVEPETSRSTPPSRPEPASDGQDAGEDAQDGSAAVRQRGREALQRYIADRLLWPASAGGVRAPTSRLVAAERLLGPDPTADTGNELWKLTYRGAVPVHVWIEASFEPTPAEASHRIVPGRIAVSGRVDGLEGVVATRRALIDALRAYGEHVSAGRTWTIPVAEQELLPGHGGIRDEAANRAAVVEAARQLAAESRPLASTGRELSFDDERQRLTAKGSSRKGPVQVVFEFAAGTVADETVARAELIGTDGGAPAVRITISDSIPEADRATVARRVVANQVAATLAKLQPSLSDRLPGRLGRGRDDGVQAELRVELTEWAAAKETQRHPYESRILEIEQRVGKILERLGQDRRPGAVERVLAELGFDSSAARSEARRLTGEYAGWRAASTVARRLTVEEAADQAVNDVAAQLGEQFRLTDADADRVRTNVVDALVDSTAVGRRLHALAVVEAARAMATGPEVIAARVLAGQVSELPRAEAREYWQALLELELGPDTLIGIAEAQPSVSERLRQELPEALLEDTLSVLRSAGMDARLQDDGRILVNRRTVRTDLTDMIRTWLRRLLDNGASPDQAQAQLAPALGQALGWYANPGASDTANSLAALESLLDSRDVSPETKDAAVAAAEGVLDSNAYADRPLRDDEQVPPELARRLAARTAPPSDPYEALRPQRHRVAGDRIVDGLTELVVELEDIATGPPPDVAGRTSGLTDDARRLAEVLAEARTKLLERAEAKASSGEKASEQARALGEEAREQPRSDRFAKERLRRTEKERQELAEVADRHGRIRARYETAAVLAEDAGKAYRELEAALASGAGPVRRLVADALAARRAYEAYEQAMGTLRPHPHALGAAAPRLRLADLGAVTREVNRQLAAQGVEVPPDVLQRRLIPKLSAAVGADGAVIKVGPAEVRLNFVPGGRDGDAEPVEVLGPPERPGTVLIGTRPQAPRGVREVGATANVMRGVAIDTGDLLGDLVRIAARAADFTNPALEAAAETLARHLTLNVSGEISWQMSVTGTGADFALPGAQLVDKGESTLFHVRGDWEVEVRTPEPEARWSEKQRVDGASIELWVAHPFTEPTPGDTDTVVHPDPLRQEQAEQAGRAWFPEHVALGPTALAGVQGEVIEALGSLGNRPGVRDSVRNLVRERLPSRIHDLINYGVDEWVYDGKTPVGRVVIETRLVRAELVGTPSNRRGLDWIRVAFSQITGETTGSVKRAGAGEVGGKARPVEETGRQDPNAKAGLGRTVVSLLRKALRVDAVAIKPDLHRFLGHAQAYRLELKHEVTVWPYDALHTRYGSKEETPVAGAGLFLIPETRAYQIGLPVAKEAARGVREDGSHVLRDDLRPGPPEGKRAAPPTYLGERMPGGGLALAQELTGTRDVITRLVDQLRKVGWLPALDEDGNPRLSSNELERDGQLKNIEAIKILSRELVETSYDQLAQDGIQIDLVRYPVGRSDAEHLTLRIRLRQDWAKAQLIGHTDAETLVKLTVASGRFGSKTGELRTGAPGGEAGLEGFPHNRGGRFAWPSTAWSESEGGVILNRGVLIENPGETAVFEIPHELAVEVVSTGEDRPEVEVKPQEGAVRLLVPASLLPDDGPSQPPARNTPDGTGTPLSVLQWAHILHLDGTILDSVRKVLPKATEPGSAANLHYSSFANVLNQAANAEWLLLGQERHTDLAVDPRGNTPLRSSLSMVGKPGRSTFVGAMEGPVSDVTLGFPYRETASGRESAEQVASIGETGAEHRHQVDWTEGDSQTLHRRYGRERIGVDTGIHYVYEMPYDVTLTGKEYGVRSAPVPPETVRKTAVYAVPEWVALQRYAAGELPVPPAQVRDALERYASEELALDPQTVAKVLERYGEDLRELAAAREALQAFLDDPDAWRRLDASATDELLDRYREHPDRPPPSRKPGIFEARRQKAALLEAMSEPAVNRLRLGDDLASRLAARLTKHVSDGLARFTEQVRDGFPEARVPEVTAQQITRLVDDGTPVPQARSPRVAVPLPDSLANAVGHTWIEPSQLHDHAGGEVRLLGEVSRLVDAVEPGAMARTPGLRTSLFGQLAGERWTGYLEAMLTPHGYTIPIDVATGKYELEHLTIRLKATLSRNGVVVGDLPKASMTTQDYFLSGRASETRSGLSWEDSAGLPDVAGLPDPGGAEAGRGHIGSGSLDIQDTHLSGLKTDPGVYRVERGLSISVEVMRGGATDERTAASAQVAAEATAAATAALGAATAAPVEAATSPAAAMDAAADAAEKLAEAATTAAVTAAAAGSMAAAAVVGAAAATSAAADRADAMQAVADRFTNPIAYARLAQAAVETHAAAAEANAAADGLPSSAATDEPATTAAKDRNERGAKRPHRPPAAASVVGGRLVQHWATGMMATDGPASVEPSPLPDPRSFRLPHDTFVHTVDADLYSAIFDPLAGRDLLGGQPTEEQRDQLLTQLVGMPVIAGLAHQATGQGDRIVELSVPGKPGRFVRVIATADLSGLRQVGAPTPTEIRYEYRDQQVVGQGLGRDRTRPVTGRLLAYLRGESAAERIDVHKGNRTEVKVYMAGQGVVIDARVDYRLRFLVVEQGPDGQLRPVQSRRDPLRGLNPPLTRTVTGHAVISVFNSETGLGAIRDQLETPAPGAPWLLGRSIPAGESLDALLATAKGEGEARYQSVRDQVEEKFGAPGRRTIHLRASAADPDALDPLDVVRSLAKDRPGDELFVTITELDGSEWTYRATPGGELIPRLPDNGYAAARATLAPADVARANRAGVDLRALFASSRGDERTFTEVVRQAVDSEQQTDNSHTATVLERAPAAGGQPDRAGTNRAIERAAASLADRIGEVSSDREGRVLVAPKGADYVLRFEAGDPEPDRQPAAERRLRSRREPTSEPTPDGREIIRVIVTDSLPVDELTSEMTTRDVWVRRIVAHEVAEEAVVRRRSSGQDSPVGQPDALARGADPSQTTLSAHDEAHLAEVVYLADLLRTLQIEEPSFSPAVAEVEQQLRSMLDELGVVDDLHAEARMALLERHLPGESGHAARIVGQLRHRPDPALEAALDAAEAASPDLTSEDQLSDSERKLRGKSIDPAASPVSLGGAGNAFLVRLTDGTLGIYKPILPQSARPLSIPDSGLANREVATYRLDNELGFGLVPPTTFWHGPFGWGSLQQFVENTTDGHPAVDSYSRLERESMAILDYIAGNLDRSLANYRTGSDGELVAVDHGYTFPVAVTDPIVSRFVAAQPGRELVDLAVEQVREVDPHHLAGRLRAAGLSRHAIDGALARLSEVQAAGAIPAWKGGYADPPAGAVTGIPVPSDQPPSPNAAESDPSAAAGVDQGRHMTFKTSQLQHAFGHAEAFGVTGNWNKAAGEAFQRAIEAHVRDTLAQEVDGSYRGEPVTHFYNPSNGLNVIRTASGEFWSGWRLSPQQVWHLLSTGRLGGA